MEWIINCESEEFKIICFEYDNRNWEIILDTDLTDRQIHLKIITRVDELTDEFLAKGTYEFSDLIVDYTTKKQDNNI